MTHYQQIPLPLSNLFLIYEETRTRVIELNKVVPDLHVTRLDTVFDNVVVVNVDNLTPADRTTLQIESNFPAQTVWVTNRPAKDWEVLWKWRPPLGVAQFTFYARGLGPKAPSEKTLPAGTFPARDPNSGRQLVRMSYSVQDMQVTPDEWIDWLERDAMPPQWTDLVRFLGFLGKLESWNPIIHALTQGKPCIPVKTIPTQSAPA